MNPGNSGQPMPFSAEDAEAAEALFSLAQGQNGNESLHSSLPIWVPREKLAAGTAASNHGQLRVAAASEPLQALSGNTHTYRHLHPASQVRFSSHHVGWRSFGMPDLEKAQPGTEVGAAVHGTVRVAQHAAFVPWEPSSPPNAAATSSSQHCRAGSSSFRQNAEPGTRVAQEQSHQRGAPLAHFQRPIQPDAINTTVTVPAGSRQPATSATQLAAAAAPDVPVLSMAQPRNIPQTPQHHASTPVVAGQKQVPHTVDGFRDVSAQAAEATGTQPSCLTVTNATMAEVQRVCTASRRVAVRLKAALHREDAALPLLLPVSKGATRRQVRCRACCDAA